LLIDELAICLYIELQKKILPFLNNFERLSCSLKRRLVIENDEKNFSIDDVLEISHSINIPVIYDNLHNICYEDNKYSIKEIYKKVMDTWKTEDGNMKVHYSQQAEGKNKGAHSNTIFTKEFLNYYSEIKEFDPDIMLEVKDKDVSASERNHFKKIMNEENSVKVKDYLEKLVFKYNSKYMIDSYFFSQ
jgi:UV DNA damage endonuclease